MALRKVAHEAAPLPPSSPEEGGRSTETQRDSPYTKFSALWSIRGFALLLLVSLSLVLALFMVLNTEVTMALQAFINRPEINGTISKAATDRDTSPIDDAKTLNADPWFEKPRGNPNDQRPMKEQIQDTIQNEIAPRDTWTLLDLEKRKT
eukprot:CAMPEP_0184696440 /NCGR_PEP_ID=MMETSP0313-20130426/3734_1 /TAXON_ID=2792 /ORGANISM="Porphyridium aerugineum, Strain SAG 1380-2" /LENGTH=149 /DNA_ID=CAMNT_0027155067 /DNA_START=83 /DNA_END=529 /DNA_ORIENTATION=+